MSRSEGRACWPSRSVSSEIEARSDRGRSRCRVARPCWDSSSAARAVSAGHGRAVDEQGHRKVLQAAAHEPEQGQRIRVGPMGVVQGDQEGTHRHLPEPVQNGMKTVGGPLVGLVPVVARSQGLRTEQRFQGLADQPEREGSLGHIGPAYAYHHATGSQFHGVLE